jgi:hypothetical protein
MVLLKLSGMILTILLSRIIPRGIIGVVIVSLLFTFITFGNKITGGFLLVFITPILISLLVSPECLTTYTQRNREYYGKFLNMCEFIRKHIVYVEYARVLGEILLVVSIFMNAPLKYILVVIGITLITIEMMIFHPVPLLEREYREWKLR